MSFMFNPHPYDDPTAVNQLDAAVDGVIDGTRATAADLAAAILARARPGCVAVIDGYPAADLGQLATLVAQHLSGPGLELEIRSTEALFRSPDELERLYAANLPEDPEEDPIRLFGRLDDRGYQGLFDEHAVAALAAELAQARVSDRRRVVLVVGCGAAERRLRAQADLVCWADVTPKQAVLRAKAGRYRNLGDRVPRPFKALLRRCYYIDFEAAGHLRWELLRERALDRYVCADDPGHLVGLTLPALLTVTGALARQPFRCKPVYIEGVWGGHYVSRVRRLPDSFANVAWVFDLIPLEVSIVVEAGGQRIELPYFTFVQIQGEAIMGPACVQCFGGYFPIRCNYDDTFHSSGSMSIQVHPGEAYARERFGELGRQDESYYVVAAGPGAKTYCGFREEADVEAFLACARQAECDGTAFDHDCFVNSVPSRPGQQFLLPAGTIHASGRNQVVLEIGSLTVGSYTFKLYDYLRADLDGTRRPIHLMHGGNVLDHDRRAGWVAANLIPAPRELRRDADSSERLVGEHALSYYSLREVDFTDVHADDTAGTFHILVLVDGERVRIESLDEPGRCYEAGYLDMVVVPAATGRYRVVNLGDQPVRLHKTMLKD